MTSDNCLNCENKIETGQRFCSQCGQKLDVHRISWHEVWHDALHYATHTDKGIFFVLKSLFTRPGIVIREYLQGKRKKYISPVTLLLICAGISYISFNIFNVVGLNTNNMPDPATMEFATPQAKEKYVAMYKRSERINNFMTKNSKQLTIAATPLFAFFFWLLFFKAGYYFTEHLVANLFIIAATILLYALIFLPVFYFAGSSRVFLAGTTIFLVFEVLFRARAYYQWFDYSGWKKAIKIIVYSGMVSFFWVLISGGFIYLYLRGYLG